MKTGNCIRQRMSIQKRAFSVLLVITLVAVVLPVQGFAASKDQLKSTSYEMSDYQLILDRVNEEYGMDWHFVTQEEHEKYYVPLLDINKLGTPEQFEKNLRADCELYLAGSGGVYLSPEEALARPGYGPPVPCTTVPIYDKNGEILGYETGPTSIVGVDGYKADPASIPPVNGEYAYITDPPDIATDPFASDPNVAKANRTSSISGAGSATGIQ